MFIYGHVVSPTSTEAWFLVGPSLLDSGLVNSHHVPYILTCSAVHTWHHRICTYPKQRTTYQVMSIWKTRRMRAKGLADIGFGKPGCRHGLLHERVHKNLHIEPNQDISCPQHTRTLTTPCCLVHPPPTLIGFGGGAGYLYPNYTLSIMPKPYKFPIS